MEFSCESTSRTSILNAIRTCASHATLVEHNANMVVRDGHSVRQVDGRGLKGVDNPQG